MRMDRPEDHHQGTAALSRYRCVAWPELWRHADVGRGSEAAALGSTTCSCASGVGHSAVLHALCRAHASASEVAQIIGLILMQQKKWERPKASPFLVGI